MLSESQIIALFQSNPGALDDCAVLSSSQQLKDTQPNSASDAHARHCLVTTDVMAEGTHFRREWSQPEDLAARLFFSNHSDLCASGASPTECVLQLGFPKDLPDDFVRRFARELLAILGANRCSLLGGDTFLSEHMVLGLTLWGRAPRVLARANGKPGDTLYVSGILGLSALGHRLLEESRNEAADRARGAAEQPTAASPELTRNALARFRRGQSRPDWANRAAADPRVHAAIDISDGLRTDAGRLAVASGLVLLIHAEKVPLPPGFPLSLADALDSGEEFEILFLGAEGLAEEYGAVAIGMAAPAPQDGSAPVRFEVEGRPWHPDGKPYEHFA